MIFIVQLFGCFIFISYMNRDLYADVDISQDRSQGLKPTHVLGPAFTGLARPLRVSTCTSASHILASPTGSWPPNKTCPWTDAATVSSPGLPSSPHKHALLPYRCPPSLPHAESLVGCPPCPCHTVFRTQNPTQPCNHLLEWLPRMDIVPFTGQNPA